MKEVLLVGAGSFLGGMGRYYLSGLFLQSFPNMRFPGGTFIVNVLGCFAIGVLAGLAERQHMFSQHLRLLLITGFLGGFTTFSAFSYESLALARTSSTELALIYVTSSVTACLAAAWIGLKLT